jgi:hypothetical protein
MPGETTQPGRSFWGRLFVMGLFWGIFSYAVGSLVVSVVTTLYGRPPAPYADAASQAKRREWCLRTLAGLRDELESEVSLELTRAATPTAPLGRFEAFDERWTAELEDAAFRCDSSIAPAMADAYATLRTLHQGYAEAVVRVVQTRTETGKALAEQVKSLTAELRPERP